MTEVTDGVVKAAAALFDLAPRATAIDELQALITRSPSSAPR
jgi:hypothetical protein